MNNTFRPHGIGTVYLPENTAESEDSSFSNRLECLQLAFSLLVIPRKEE
jgi:hypothetical protein